MIELGNDCTALHCFASGGLDLKEMMLLSDINSFDTFIISILYSYY